MTDLYPRHAFNVAPGEPQPSVASLIAQFFRRAIAAVLRKSAAPEVQTPAPGAAATARFDCCGHCLTGSPCEPRDSHPAPCSGGCNDVRPYDERHCAVPSAHGRTDPYYCTLPAHHYGDPALGNDMLAQVRDQWNAWHDDDVHARPRPTFTPSEQMDTGEFKILDAKVDAVLRPVNGRSLGTQPRRHPELDRQFANRPGRDVLERVLTGLRKLPVYGEKPVAEVLEAERPGRELLP
jgi:hypothetical protein